MNLLLDTNIILNIIRAKNIIGIKDFINPDNSLLYISIVTEAEIRALSIKNNWGENRKRSLDAILDEVDIIGIDQLFVNIYAEIDAYSQRLNPRFETYPFDTPRNMGKNDLWIASLAALLGLRLVTTDSDFYHLHDIFFEVRKIAPVDFVRFF
ncbi:MAG: type II toxin-antitoxin system VapC family toxin [Mucilaginibacter sp.]|nr:type II toxin-antitoxin system VapC family toxin [Mucilaginibacter sp.]